jgi:S1-C subfamily serine protease
VVIDSSGLILTCAHVVDRARDIHVHLPGADGAETVAGTCVARDAQRDLAIIRVNRGGLACVAVSPCAPPGAAPVVAIGALREPADQRHGRITTLGASLQSLLGRAGGPDYSALIETTAALEPGFSGGPLLDADGRLVGINVAMRTGHDGARRGYAIGLDAGCCDAIRRMCAEAGM